MNVLEMRRSARPRPRIVTVAARLLAVGGALFAGEVVLSAERFFTGMRVFEQGVADGLEPDGDAFAGVNVAVHLVPAVVGVADGCLLVVLALFTGFGHNWARAVAWILAFPVLIWYGILAVLFFLLSSASNAGSRFGSGSGSWSGSAQMASRYDEAWPAWLNTLDTGLIVAVSAALIAALVCQTVPAADAYFRRAAPKSGGGR